MAGAAAFYRVCTLSLLPCSSVLPRSSAFFRGRISGMLRRWLSAAKVLTTTHGGEIVPNFGTIPGRRLRHSVQLHPRRGGSLCRLFGDGCSASECAASAGRRGCCAAIVSIFGTIYLQAAKVGRCRRCHSARFNGLFTARV